MDGSNSNGREKLIGSTATYPSTYAIRHRAADSLHQELDRVVVFITSPIPCDSCFIYVQEGGYLVLRSKNPHTVRFLSTLVLVGAEIERTKLETENMQLTGRFKTRKVVDRAESVLQCDLSLNEEIAYQMMHARLVGAATPCVEDAANSEGREI